MEQKTLQGGVKLMYMVCDLKWRISSNQILHCLCLYLQWQQKKRAGGGNSGPHEVSRGDADFSFLNGLCKRFEVEHMSYN